MSAEPSPSSTEATSGELTEPGSETTKSWRFYLIIATLSLIAFASALEGSVIAIALPQITHELSAGDNYVWIASSYLVAQTAIQPLCAQLSNILGRRNLMVFSIAVFAFGSGIAGGATDAPFLIAGRTVQGLGSGGVMMLIELIICDLVPLRERGKYLGYVQSPTAIGAIVGPVVGGALATANWRWIFYLNIPIAGIAMIIMIIFLRLNHEKPRSWKQAVLRVDWIGNAIFVASICSLLVGLVFGGTVYAWSSWRVILPVVLGACGWLCFHVYEWKPPAFCKEVSIPPRIFANRTSVAGFYIDFVSSMLLQWVAFFWPIYFQGTRGTSPLKAGIYFIPFEAFLLTTAVVAGGLLTKLGHYRPLHLVGFVLSTLGPGLNILLSDSTPKVVWVWFQIVDSIGRGILLPTTLPAIMASLPDSDAAAITGIDSAVRGTLQNGRAYQFVSGEYVQALPPAVKAEVITVYLRALRAVWIGAVAFGATGLVAVLVEKHIPLRTELDTKYGLKHEEEKATTVEHGTIDTRTLEG
ncbi:major facilitator superfamily MFS_1 [Ophiobolus disseminans]|uniref:Major facilitator superfamily MFS_1 n=1 Tax=Ophiobolus disseminans TaxID=1469910 RepID=A0A6A7A759_9PLEO|nr:major facilitator superfamily MFS_1 [Ophiobolus disseminans]